MAVAEMTQTTQYLTFNLGEETFALDISKVREVLDFTTVTKVPRMPEFMRGVINLRGSVVPVVDLQLMLGMKTMGNTANNSIIIMEVSVDDGDTYVLGALANSVQEVVDLVPLDILSVPMSGMQLAKDHTKEMDKKGGKLIIILDIDKMFPLDKLSSVRQDVPSNGQKTANELEAEKTTISAASPVEHPAGASHGSARLEDVG